MQQLYARAPGRGGDYVVDDVLVFPSPMADGQKS